MLVKRHHLLVAAATLTLGLFGTAANAADIFSLTSSTFKDSTMMPKNAANSAANAPTNPNCVGENVSPQLSWTGVPEGTKSFVMLMTDPEGRGGAGVNHWVAYGIPASVTGFAQGEVSKPSDKYVGGKSTQGVGFYSGPCTPPGTTPHHYTFVLVATDFDPKELPPGLTKDEVTAKIAPAGRPCTPKARPVWSGCSSIHGRCECARSSAHLSDAIRLRHRHNRSAMTQPYPIPEIFEIDRAEIALETWSWPFASRPQRGHRSIFYRAAKPAAGRMEWPRAAAQSLRHCRARVARRLLRDRLFKLHHLARPGVSRSQRL